MNLETGEKLVKLLDDEKNEDQQKYYLQQQQSSTATAIMTNTGALATTEQEEKVKEEETNTNSKQELKITRLGNTQIDPETSAKITSQLLQQSSDADKKKQQQRKNVLDSIASLNDFQADHTVDEKDYETMYRTLMSLPEEDREPLDIPTLPTNMGDEKALQTFIARIKEIWQGRQDYLKEIEEEYMANVPDIIESRILFLKEYISTPIQYLESVIKEEDDTTDADIDDDDDAPNTIIEVLKDLEYHLSDLDMARDFYTMGGWPLLISLLTDEIHGLEQVIQEIVLAQNYTNMIESSTTTSDSSSSALTIKLPEEIQLYIQRLQHTIWNIQSMTCWCIGTAIKNVDEFKPWALEDFSDLLRQHQPVITLDATGNSADETTVNAITILLSKISVDEQSNPVHDYSNDLSSLESKLWFQKKQKELYALGALLRGNFNAIHYFGSVNGPLMLSNLFHSFMTPNHDDVQLSSDILQNNFAMKVLTRIMSLGGDLVADLSAISADSDINNDNDIEIVTKQLLSLLSSQDWCSIPKTLMLNGSIHTQTKAHETMVHMAPYCSFEGIYIEDVDPFDVNDL